MGIFAKRQPRKPRSWFATWAWFLGIVAVAGILTMLAATSYTWLHRPPPLPSIKAPAIAHDGIYPTAAQELTKPIAIRVAPLHYDTMVNALVADIESAGGRVVRQRYRKIDALAPASYLQGLETLRDGAQSNAHRNTRYQEWAMNVASRQSKPAYGRWTSFTILVQPVYMIDRATSAVWNAGAVTVVISVFALALSYLLRADF